jgi:hypothetical protein
MMQLMDRTRNSFRRETSPIREEIKRKLDPAAYPTATLAERRQELTFGGMSPGGRQRTVGF